MTFQKQWLYATVLTLVVPERFEPRPPDGAIDNALEEVNDAHPQPGHGLRALVYQPMKVRRAHWRKVLK